MDLSDPGIEQGSLASQVDSLPTELSGNLLVFKTVIKKLSYSEIDIKFTILTIFIYLFLPFLNVQFINIKTILIVV